MAAHLTGTLLCRVAGCRLAVAAREVTAIESTEAFFGDPSPARRAFGATGDGGRVLMADGGYALGVDTLEVEGEPLPVLPLPAVLQRMAGGSLRGFVQAHDALWPLVELVSLQRFVDGLTQETP